MLARLCAFVIWALVAATAVFWGLRLLVRAPAAPAYAVAVGESAATRGDLTRLLGAAPVIAPTAAAAPAASSRFRLLGIVAPKYASSQLPGPQGVALIAVDGKMPKAYTVGSRLDGDLVLQSVSLRTVSISSAPGVPGITLELPLLPAAATGALPLPGAGGGYMSPSQIIIPQIIIPQIAPQAPLQGAGATPPAPVPPRNDSNAAPTQ